MEKKNLESHFSELQYRVILSLSGIMILIIVCLFRGDFFLKILINPFIKANLFHSTSPYLQAIHPAETFIVYLKASFLFAVVFSSPWIFYNIWKFIAKGLYPHEKKIVYILLPFAVILFISGTLFFLMLVAPLIISFFIGFDPGIDFIKPEFSFQSYVNFIISLTLVFGILFQLPILIFLLYFTGFININTLKKSRKFFALILFIIAALLTPPDIISQIALALPLYILFEISIWIIIIFFRKRDENHP